MLLFYLLMNHRTEIKVSSVDRLETQVEKIKKKRE